MSLRKLLTMSANNVHSDWWASPRAWNRAACSWNDVYSAPLFYLAMLLALQCMIASTASGIRHVAYARFHAAVRTPVIQGIHDDCRWEARLCIVWACSACNLSISHTLHAGSTQGLPQDDTEEGTEMCAHFTPTSSPCMLKKRFAGAWCLANMPSSCRITRLLPLPWVTCLGRG